MDKSENGLEAFVNTKTESHLLKRDGNRISPDNLQRHRHHDDGSHPCKVQFHTNQQPSNFHTNVSSVSTFRMNSETPVLCETHSAAKCKTNVAPHSASSAKLRWKENHPIFRELSGLHILDSTESQKFNTVDKTKLAADFLQKSATADDDTGTVLITGINGEHGSQTTKMSLVQPTQPPTERLVNTAENVTNETVTYRLNSANSVQNHPLIESTDIS
ncbi:hypothetical protein P879_09089 [Paragonimus westermani]|uniref:Uncharacterized protein n=1 Tax=Paragonimus westermani TaxID=34504 RepID=A0A8T0D827_9TREM|nr:hypothetical protein P879_09089 [Paragonimus westermani]